MGSIIKGNRRKIILVIEDLDKPAEWQMSAMHHVFPDRTIIHVATLEEAHNMLLDNEIIIAGVLTDNGYPIHEGGKRLGSKSTEGGAGTLLVKEIRQGMFGNEYRNLPVSWHTASINEKKTARVLSYDNAEYYGLTHCFTKGDGAVYYEEMGKHIKQLI